MSSIETYRDLGWAPTLVGEPGQLDAATIDHLAGTGYDIRLTGDDLQGDLFFKTQTDPKVLLLRQDALHDYAQPVRLDTPAALIGHIITSTVYGTAVHRPEDIAAAAPIEDASGRLITAAATFPDYATFVDWEDWVREADALKYGETGHTFVGAMMAGYDGGRPVPIADRATHTSFFDLTGDYVTVGFIPNNGFNRLYFSQLPQ